MVVNLKCGMCNFELGDFKGSASCLTDVPVGLLDAFIDYFDRGNGIVVFDDEGSFFTLVLTKYNEGVFIIEEKDKAILHNFSSMNVNELGKELINDIENNLIEWAEFITSSDDVEEVEQHRNEIIQRVAVLRRLLK